MISGFTMAYRYHYYRTYQYHAYRHDKFFVFLFSDEQNAAVNGRYKQ